MAELSAWAHLRSGGRQKSAIADELIAFGNRRDWQLPLIDLATQCEAQVAADWKAYCEAYDRGAFDATGKGGGRSDRPSRGAGARPSPGHRLAVA